MLTAYAFLNGAGSIHANNSMTPAPKHPTVDVDRKEVPTVKVVHPKHDSTSGLTLERIATVEPYYRADLRARASGIVKRVPHDIGETVKRGEVLIEIDVAEYEQDVAQKAALISQRNQEVKLAEARLKETKSGLLVADATIAQKKAEAEAATATRDLKQSRYARFKDLGSQRTVVGSAVLEEERDYKSSEAALAAAQANVARAEADKHEAQCAVEAVEADVALKRAQVVVAQQDWERATIVAGYGKVLAPFDGIIVRRNVDVGSFVQNATSGMSETLISISRIDLLTVVAQFPDNAAPYVAEGIPATIKIADLPGFPIVAKVTRCSPTIQDSDRTIRVEIDLFNGNASARKKFEAVSQDRGSALQLKGLTDHVPIAAIAANAGPVRLVPGMNSSVELAVGGTGPSYALPSAAVYSKGGAMNILVVEKNRTRQLPVRIKVNDGQNVMLTVINRTRTQDGTIQEELSELKGNEQVVLANQLQLGDDAIVEAALTNW